MNGETTSLSASEPDSGRLEALDEYLGALRERIIRDASQVSGESTPASDVDLRLAIRNVVLSEARFFSNVDNGRASRDRSTLLSFLIASASLMTVVVIILLVIYLSIGETAVPASRELLVGIATGALTAIVGAMTSLFFGYSTERQRRRRAQSAAAILEGSLSLRMALVDAVGGVERLARVALKSEPSDPIGRLTFELVDLGVWTREDRDIFSRAMQARNGIVHGVSGDVSPVQIQGHVAELHRLGSKIGSSGAALLRARNQQG